MQDTELEVSLIGWFLLRYINLLGSFNAELNFEQFRPVSVQFFCLHSVKYQNSSISNNSL